MQVALTDPKAEPLRESQRQLNRGQAEQLRLLVDYVESFMRDTEVIEPELMSSARGRETVESAAIMNAAEAMGAGEGHVYTQYHQACFARQHLPQVWSAVRAGDVPVRSLVRVICAAERLVSAKHRERLDAEAAAYAVTHRPARLNAWLNRFVARAEPAQHAQRCRRGHAERRVWLEHLEDGVSLLHAMLPTLTAEAIKNRLVDVARSPKQVVPYDPCVERPAAGRSEPSREGSAQGGFDWLGLPSDVPVAGPGGWSEVPPLPSGEKVDAEHVRAADVDAADVEAADFDVAGRGVASGFAASAGSAGHARLPMSRAAGDPRTQAQREADLLSSWLLTGVTASGVAINAHVGILVEPQSLLAGSGGATGTTAKGPSAMGTSYGADRPALSRNRRHAYPAEMIRRIILSDEHQITWTPVPVPVPEAGPDLPVTRDHPPGPPPDSPGAVLEPSLAAFEPLVRVYDSRFVPKLLRRAIEFRDGTCQAPGCMVAAEHCDIDHQIPWPHGQTTASNLWALCRKHHRLKTAGFLDVPADRPPPLSP